MVAFKNMRRRIVKYSLFSLLILFLFINLIAFFHAYKFTHFTGSVVNNTIPNRISFIEKIKFLFLGMERAKPVNTRLPKTQFKTVQILSNKKIEAWYIQVPNAKGTVLLFHGYAGNKASQLPQSEYFQQLGYNSLLVDFMGSGGSEGNQTTIGFKEAAQVKSCYEWIQQLGEKRIVLYGNSMGAVAIMKCISDCDIKPTKIILECPFGTMKQTVEARFKILGIPTFRMANLLLFWGGIQNGFWAFSHNPIHYAKRINCSTLLMYGAKDNRVSMTETEEIFQNLNGKKKLVVFENSGHESYQKVEEAKWENTIRECLESREE